jgi:hypothetical protein
MLNVNKRTNIANPEDFYPYSGFMFLIRPDKNHDIAHGPTRKINLLYFVHYDNDF